MHKFWIKRAPMGESTKKKNSKIKREKKKDLSPIPQFVYQKD